MFHTFYQKKPSALRLVINICGFDRRLRSQKETPGWLLGFLKKKIGLLEYSSNTVEIGIVVAGIMLRKALVLFFGFYMTLQSSAPVDAIRWLWVYSYNYIYLFIYLYKYIIMYQIQVYIHVYRSSVKAAVYNVTSLSSYNTLLISFLTTVWISVPYLKLVFSPHIVPLK